MGERHAQVDTCLGSRTTRPYAAIGRLLHTEYVPMLTEPLPSELKHLIAQLVAREARREGPGDHSLEALSSMIV